MTLSTLTPGHAARLAAHRLQQYFTISQSRAHFLRHARGRPQQAQRLVGRSTFWRILPMALPGHGLAAPVEAAACLRRETIDNLEDMGCRLLRRMDFEAGRGEWSG